MKYTVEHIRDGQTLTSQQYEGREVVLTKGDVVMADNTMQFIGTPLGMMPDLHGPLMLAAFPQPLDLRNGDVMKVTF